MYLNVGGVAKDDVFEKMSLVASQLPLTREPRKECEAKDSAELAWIVKTVRLGAVKLRKSGKAVGSAEGERSLSLATDIVQPYREWECRADDLCFVFELGEVGYCAV